MPAHRQRLQAARLPASLLARSFLLSKHVCNAMQGLVHMARTEGLNGMMKGNWTNCVRIIPNSAVKFFMYEQLSRYVG